MKKTKKTSWKTGFVLLLSLAFICFFFWPEKKLEKTAIASEVDTYEFSSDRTDILYASEASLIRYDTEENTHTIVANGYSIRNEEPHYLEGFIQSGLDGTFYIQAKNLSANEQRFLILKNGSIEKEMEYKTIEPENPEAKASVCGPIEKHGLENYSIEIMNQTAIFTTPEGESFAINTQACFDLGNKLIYEYAGSTKKNWNALPVYKNENYQDKVTYINTLDNPFFIDETFSEFSVEENDQEMAVEKQYDFDSHLEAIKSRLSFDCSGFFGAKGCPEKLVLILNGARETLQVNLQLYKPLSRHFFDKDGNAYFLTKKTLYKVEKS